MLSVPFPTRPTFSQGRHSHNGLPIEATPCRCPHTVVLDTECVWCGHLPEPVIRRTWADRARQLERA